MMWKKLDELDELTSIVDQSFDPSINAVAIFKHSTRCSISSVAKSRLESGWPLPDNTPIYYLDILNYRPISNRIAEQFNVRHESPQIILIKEGEVVYHTSHLDISTSNIESALKAFISE